MIALSEHLRNLLSRSKDKLEFEIKVRTIEIEAQKDFLVIQKEQIQKQNTEHAESLRYAKKIQHSLLPSKEEIKQIFPKSFVLFKPKDIVSGDFYWCTQTRTKKIIACADCTGHGIPGAFLSILGISVLNTIINILKITSENDILNKLRENIIDALSQKNSNDSINDGMDISICVLNTKNNILEYAGAYNPLYILRGKSLIQLKTDNMPVGNYIISKPFTLNHIQLETKDRVYMFSDGYGDQVGGEKNKKLKRGGFKTIINQIQNKNMKLQASELDIALQEWMGDNEQIDDITIIGFEI